MIRKSVTNPYRVPSIAIPTLLMVCAILTAWLAGLIGYIVGVVPLQIALPLNLLAAYAAFTGFHDAAHFALGRKQWISVVAGELLGVVLLASFQVFRHIHQRHHRHTNDEDKDPDAWLGNGPAWLLPFRWMLVDVHYLQSFRSSELKLRPLERIAMYCGMGVGVSLVAGLMLSGHLKTFTVLWLVPARLSLLCAVYYADFVPHQRPHAVPRKHHALAHTAIIRGRFLSLCLLGHNMHLIHHLYPGLPFYRCFRIWRERKAELLSKGAREVSLTRASHPVEGEDSKEHRKVVTVSSSRSPMQELASTASLHHLPPVRAPSLHER